MNNLDFNLPNIYLEINSKDKDNVIEFMNKNNIEIVSQFYHPLDKVFEQNIEFFIDNIGEGYMDEDIENKIYYLNEDEKTELINKSIDLLNNNEYLAQTLNECTTEAIEQSLEDLFIKNEE